MGRKNLKLRWSLPALNDLIEAQDHIAKDSPAAARMVAQRVWDASEQLLGKPEIGRNGHAGRKPYSPRHR